MIQDDANQRLDLDDDSDSVPWLESAEDDARDSASPLKIIGLLLFGLIAIGAVIGGIYIYQQSQQQMVAGEGELIRAPKGPYKVRPKDYGGKTFAGTGDASPQAAEGRERVGALAGDDKLTTNGVLVQLGAFDSQTKASSHWYTLSRRYDYISGLPNRVAEAEVEGATVYRLSVLAPDAASAQSICDRLKTAGRSCLVVR